MSLRGPDPELVHHTWREVFDEDVGLAHHAEEYRAARRQTSD